jgi:ATP-dependent DNA ligase
MAFDVLYLDGRGTMKQPYVERRRLLDGLGITEGPSWRAPSYHVDDGAALFEATRASGTGRHHLQAARRPEGCYAGN